MRTLTLFLFLLVLPLSLSAQDKASEKPLTNDDVIQLVAAKLGDSIVVAKIAETPAEALDSSTSSLIALKKKGVSDSVIDAIMKRIAARHQAQAAGNSSTAPSVPAPSGRMAKLKSRVKSALTREPDSEEEAATAEPDTRPCAKNFSVEGSFLKGRVFRSKVDVGSVPVGTAFPRVTRYLAANGWRMASSDRESGVVTATQDVAWSEGKTAPLSVIVKRIEGHTWITMSFSIGAGTGSPQDAVVSEFCAIAESATHE